MCFRRKKNKNIINNNTFDDTQNNTFNNNQKNNIPKTNPVEDLLKTAFDRLKTNAAAERVCGQPIIVGDITLIPLSKVAVGFVSGGAEKTEVKKNHPYPMSGGSGGGYSVAPIGFLMIEKGKTKILHLDKSNPSPLSALLSILPKTAGALLSGAITGMAKKEEIKNNNESRNNHNTTTNNRGNHNNNHSTYNNPHDIHLNNNPNSNDYLFSNGKFKQEKITIKKERR
jgi:uncharacterized spore protein YtfJ